MPLHFFVKCISFIEKVNVFRFFNRKGICFCPSVNRNKICGLMDEKFLQLSQLRVGLFHTQFYTNLSMTCLFTGRRRKSLRGVLLEAS